MREQISTIDTCCKLLFSKNGIYVQIYSFSPDL